MIINKAKIQFILKKVHNETKTSIVDHRNNLIGAKARKTLFSKKNYIQREGRTINRQHRNPSHSPHAIFPGFHRQT